MLGVVIMSGEPTTSSSQQNIPGWAANALIGAAGICLITSIVLAIADKVAAGTLTAGLFVVCVLFVYLPQMKSFTAFGIAVEWLREASRAGVELEKSGKELKAQFGAHAPKEEVAATVEKVDKAITQLSTANTALSATLTALDLTVRSPHFSRPPFSATTRSD
jgi:hypothetical protein